MYFLHTLSINSRWGIQEHLYAQLIEVEGRKPTDLWHCHGFFSGLGGIKWLWIRRFTIAKKEHVTYTA